MIRSLICVVLIGLAQAKTEEEIFKECSKKFDPATNDRHVKHCLGECILEASGVAKEGKIHDKEAFVAGFMERFPQEEHGEMVQDIVMTCTKVEGVGECKLIEQFVDCTIQEANSRGLDTNVMTFFQKIKE